MTPVFVITLSDIFGLIALALCVLGGIAFAVLSWWTNRQHKQRKRREMMKDRT